jgi:hypothetical protein
MTILKGGVDGFSCFSLISVILFTNVIRIIPDFSPIVNKFI